MERGCAADRRLVDVDDLVDVLQALDLVVRGGRERGAVELARHRGIERVDEQRRLAAAGDAGDAGEQAERDLGGDVFQVIAAGVDHLERAARVGRLALGDRHRELAGEVLAGPRARRGDEVVDVAFGDDVAAVDAGAGADVEHVIGGADGVLVVLDHDDGVAEVAQAFERFEQAGVVALVQADGGLVQHIEHAGEAGADLRGEADALALAAGERAGGAAEGEIVEADVDQELEPLADFLEHAAGDLVLFVGEVLRQLGDPVAGLAHGELGDVGDGRAGDLDAERLGLEARAVTGGAGHVGEIFLQVLARPFGFGFLEAALQVGDDALERLLGLVAAQAVVVDEFDLVLAGAVEDRGLRLLGRSFHLVSSVKR